MRPGGLDYELCAKCGPVRTSDDLADLPADWQAMDVNELLDALGPDAFDRLIKKL